MMKKRWISMAAAMILAANVLPVSAGDLSNEEPAGDTEVTANVSNNGDVTYLLSIPSKINFGALQQPADDKTPHMAVRNYSVEAVQITGLDTATSRVAVVLKDSEKEKGFEIVGQGNANRGKRLEYSIYNAGGTDITQGQQFTNGYLLAAFDKAGEKVDGTLQLDQNQLCGKNLDEWAGSYKGIIRFYSRVASVDEIK